MRITNTGLIYDDPSQSTPGYVLISPVRGNRAILLDPDGGVAHEWQTAGGMTHWSYLMPNGHLIANERCADPRGVMLTVSGIISEYDPQNNLIWRHIDPYQHHDARRLGDGAIYAAFCEIDEAEQKAIKGGVPGSEADGGPFGEVIRQVDEAGKTVWEWSFHNLDMDRYRIHANGNRWSYGHTNTVSPLENDQFLISSKNLNLMFILDKASGKTIWEFQDDELGGQHDAQRLQNGNILCFANGAYSRDLHHSQIWEIDPATNEVVWRYIAKDDFTSFFSPHMAGVQRLPSGNTLICEGNKGCIFEVNPDGDVVREFVNPHFVNNEDFGWINWLFRVRWYAPDSPEVVSLGL